jgi:hypothetical protein
MSDASDTVNLDNMAIMRMWQDELKTRAARRDFPDFGEQCSDYRITNLDTAPTIAHQEGNGVAQYDFYATIVYREGAMIND